MTAIVWHRADLRTDDNPALAAAMARGGKTVSMFVHETDPQLRPRGAASRWWLSGSLAAHAGKLAALGIGFEIVGGPAQDCVLDAVRRHGADAVYWNRRYGPAEREVDTAVKASLKAAGILAESFNGHLLAEPWEVATGSGGPYSVFTPFWRALRGRPVAQPLPAPAAIAAPLPPPAAPDAGYRAPVWTRKLAQHWSIGEVAAAGALSAFLDTRLAGYAEGRDVPAREACSRLSAHLAHGEIGIRQVWHATLAFAEAHPDRAADAEKFLSELGWRDFAYHLLYHRPDIATHPMQARFADIEWRDDAPALARWQQGQTGFPIVDAGMRELWQTGVMHNRVRMLVASLLAKNLLIDWRKGERWFWDTLVDADPASNPMNWQWVAGCGADAAPYFRIFNPVTQGEKFDPEGTYVRRFVPELARLDDRHLHRPFEAPGTALAASGVVLDDTYPRPLVDLRSSRERALTALARR